MLVFEAWQREGSGGEQGPPSTHSVAQVVSNGKEELATTWDTPQPMEIPLSLIRYGHESSKIVLNVKKLHLLKRYLFSNIVIGFFYNSR